MMRAFVVTITLLACAAGAGCGDEPGAGETDEPHGSEISREARTLPLPSEAAAAADPPPATAPPGRTGAPSGGRLVWDAPSPPWTEVEPGSPMRLAQYEIEGPGGPASLVVYYFGQGQGGDARANATRWAGQFAQPDGRPSTEAMTFEPLDGAAVALHVVEITGTYDGGMTMTAEPAAPQPGAMLLGGIAEGPDAPWFFKLTGPESTVRAHRDAFYAMMRSVRAAE